MCVRINIGCRKSIIRGWDNYDNSLSIKLAFLPTWIIQKLNYVLRDEVISYVLWLKSHDVKFLDARKKFPMNNGSIDTKYTSHMLEHLSKEDAERFLAEALRVLSVNGVLRIAAPDLSKLIRDYNSKRDADEFMSKMMVTPPQLSRFSAKITRLLSGFRHHQWV